MKVIEGKVCLKDSGAKVCIVMARFNHFINDSLVEGAIDGLTRVGELEKSDITLIKIPGAFEMPLTIQKIANSKKFDAIIAIGCVIKGSTAHFEYVAGPVSSALSNVALSSDTPVIFGVLTTENMEQAIDRAGVKVGNKGYEAAITALEMISINKSIDKL